MYGIDLLVEEHKNILSAIEFIKNECKNIINGKVVDTDIFREFIDFARNYADKHHHGKEEKILFKIMIDNLGTVADKLVRQGMLVEHDLGRLYIANLEESLDIYDSDKNDDAKLNIIANAVGYGNLLKRHIDKEDKVVYTYAERELEKKKLELVDEQTKVFEKENIDIKEKYESWVEDRLN